MKILLRYLFIFFNNRNKIIFINFFTVIFLLGGVICIRARDELSFKNIFLNRPKKPFAQILNEPPAPDHADFNRNGAFFRDTGIIAAIAMINGFYFSSLLVGDGDFVRKTQGLAGLGLSWSLVHFSYDITEKYASMWRKNLPRAQRFCVGTLLCAAALTSLISITFATTNTTVTLLRQLP